MLSALLVDFFDNFCQLFYAFLRVLLEVQDGRDWRFFWLYLHGHRGVDFVKVWLEADYFVCIRSRVSSTLIFISSLHLNLTHTLQLLVLLDLLSLLVLN